MKINSNEPPKIVVKVSNLILLVGILFCILLTVYAIFKIYNPPADVASPKFYIIAIFFSVLVGTLFGFCIKNLNNDLKVNISLMMLSTIVAIFTFEFYLDITKVEREKGFKAREKLAKKMGIPYDTRTKKEVLDDLIKAGGKAYPNVYPNLFIVSNGLNTKKGDLFPLGGISNITTTFHNESGYFPIVNTDEHGFINPNGLYKKNTIDIALIGDSYTEGYSVNSNENIGAVLRKKSGLNVLSLGKGGNGSLLELATIKEYAEPLEPKIVFWLYYKNDLQNLDRELKSPLLNKYLNEVDFSQNLILNQSEIDSVLLKFVNRERKNLSNFSIGRIVKLINLRSAIGLIPDQVQSIDTSTNELLSIFENILNKSNQMISKWGGKMYFVYLPSLYEVKTGYDQINDPVMNEFIKNYEFIIRATSKLDIPIIDMYNEIFLSHPDPLSLFALRIGWHYNAEGYRLVSEAVIKKLKEDGFYYPSN